MQTVRLLSALSLLLILTACGGTVEPQPSVSAPAVAAMQPSPTALPPTAVQPTPTATTPPTPTPLAPPTKAVDNDLSIARDAVQLYPVPEIYAGDRVTFQVQPYVPDRVLVNEVLVDIYVNGNPVSSNTLTRRNWAGQAEGIFEWVWDTTNQAGEHEVRIELDSQDTIWAGDENPDNNVVTFTVTVNSARALPRAQRNIDWVTTETNCCNIHVLTGTAAYRDLTQLIQATETAVVTASQRLNEPPDDKIEVYFIDRTIGQGGFAGSEMVVTYVDRNYAGGTLEQLLIHEAVHVLDRQFAPQRVKFLAEGLAVWASGGHYKPEELNERSAALVEIGRYVPLETLISDFYPVQHEIGYLQAAGFVTYLIDTYGWSTFRSFYGDTTDGDAPSDADSVNVNLQKYYGKTLAEMEADWLNYLSGILPSSTAVADLQTTIRYYDMMRRYQAAYDPTAHFLDAWLPFPADVREEGNPADFARHPQTETNITLEAMLLAAEQALFAGSFDRANVLLDSIGRTLDNGGSFVDPLAMSYLEIVRTATGLGYEVQQIDLQGDRATARVTSINGTHLSQLEMQLRRNAWILLSN